jgi:hypothetical protein
MSSKNACPAVPRIYTWDSGTKQYSGTNPGTSGGTKSLKCLAQAVLAVPHRRDKAGQGWDKTQNLVPGGKTSVGQDSFQKSCPLRNTTSIFPEQAETPYRKLCRLQLQGGMSEAELAAWRARGWMPFNEDGQTGIWCFV